MPPAHSLTHVKDGAFNRHQLYRLMVARGLSYTKASRLCEFKSIASFWKICKGAIQPKITTIHRMSARFGVPPAYFFEPESDPS